jgi:hypothetical protein
VKYGWHFAQISRWIAFAVDRVAQLLPQAQTTLTV